MAYGTFAVDTIQSSTTGTPTQFNDGSGNQVGTICRAWVQFSGTSTPTKNGSFNVSSVTYVSTGKWTITFTNAMTDANYAVCLGPGQNSTDNNTTTNAQSLTTTSFAIYHLEANSFANFVGPVSAAVFR